ncbi:hypothetical protein QBC46DRAFT_345351 [Diplogelasinospora grovesii]|uniref:Uncharacterized protein n=1 Tax=Diplogelasinospora grovesii TaxID=303347 RepID=A0AAN6N0U8_9PEZI|nr:hypothetical protein QBC46DRAFT_345351 [Diplogelasinospora grovesii]
MEKSASVSTSSTPASVCGNSSRHEQLVEGLSNEELSDGELTPEELSPDRSLTADLPSEETNTKAGADNVKAKLAQTEDLETPWDFIKLSNGDENDEIHRLEHHLKDVNHMTDKLDRAVRALSAKVEERWPTRNMPYSRVSALLIQWEDDDLGVHEEIRELHELLARWFRYSVEEWFIPKGSHGEIYMALLNKLHSFTKASDGEGSLVLIYYGGHAKQDPRNPGPIWFPRRCSSKDRHVQSAHLLPILSELDCDVLLLFDSCQAIPPRLTSAGNGVVSVLSATGFDPGLPGIAAAVGPHSFTRALIDELASLVNSFVSEDNPKPIADIALHGNLLARMKLHLSSVYKDAFGRLASDTRGGGVLFEPPRRRTAIYKFLSENKDPRPIYLAPIPANPKTESAVHSEKSTTTSEGVEESIPPRLPKVDENDVPKVLVRILLDSSTFSVDQCANWLLQAPPEAKSVEIEGVYDSLSTLLVVKMPLAVWNLLPRGPAIDLIGFITSSNQASRLNEQILRKLGFLPSLGSQFPTSNYHFTESQPQSSFDYPSIECPSVNSSGVQQASVYPGWGSHEHMDIDYHFRVLNDTSPFELTPPYIESGHRRCEKCLEYEIHPVSAVARMRSGPLLSGNYFCMYQSLL